MQVRGVEPSPSARLDHAQPQTLGPCRGCGDTGYNLSTSGPEFCPACSMGVRPEETRLRRIVERLSRESIEMSLALAVAVGRTNGFTGKMIEIGERRLEQARNDMPLPDPPGQPS